MKRDIINRIVVVITITLCITACSGQPKSVNIIARTLNIMTILPNEVNRNRYSEIKDYIAFCTDYSEFAGSLATIGAEAKGISEADVSFFDKHDVIIVCVPIKPDFVCDLDRVEKSGDAVSLYIEERGPEIANDLLQISCLSIAIDKEQINVKDKLSVKINSISVP